MRKLWKYIKPYWFYVLLIVGLTFSQVHFELALPDYMSDIVTNGIQYGGIENNEMLVIRASKMEEYLTFLNSDEQKEVLANYELAKAETEVYVDNQIVTPKEDLYYLKEDVSDKLNALLQKPIVYSGLIDSQTSDEQKIAFYQMMQDDQFKQGIIDKMDEEIKPYEDNIASAAINFVSEEYKAVGLNVELIQSNYILHVGIVMLVVSLLSVLSQIASTYLATKTAAKVGMKLRRDVFKRVETFSSAEFSKFSTSSLITRTTNDITQIQQLTQMCLRIILMAPMMGIISTLKVFRYPDLLWILLLALGLIILAMIITLVIAMPKFKSIQGLIDKMNNVMREFLDGMLVIRAFNREKSEEKRFDDSNKNLANTILFVDRVMSFMMPLMMFMMNAITVLIIWYSSKQIDINAMSVGDMMAFIQYAMHVLMSFMIVAMIWVMIPRSLVSVKRVFEVLDTKDSICDIENPQDLPIENGDLVFDKVSFKYPNASDCVLEDISFTAKKGETVAFIGSTGSGKSTLIKLIPRLFDVSSGSITYCGIDIRNVSQASLRERIGYVPQRAVLFKGDIKSNITFGKDVDENTLNRAIEVSQSTKIIEDKADGLNSEITQGGSNVSGGQKQRLSIARALAKDANIYIFDDSFSALDYQTDKKLRHELKLMCESKMSTVLIVAQRISTIKNADKIIVLNDGKMVGMGTHEELLQNCEVYVEIAKSQLSEEELQNA